jgi:WD40 repeat protein/tetratricopeptide (TPR) repeat protein
MGVVYKARQVGLKRLVALKMVLAGPHASEEDLARFRAEAEAVAKFQHGNIVQVYDVGEHDGKPYFSLEYVDGGSLDKRLNGTPQLPEDAARLVETLARAMHYAHRHSIIHRDLKPGNVLLTANGVPKITDFGLAKQLGDEQARTASGSVMGTPSYMAPEQAEGRVRDISPATDVYSLGAVLYEQLTGRPPFKAATLLDTLDQVRSQEPVPLRQFQAKIPHDLQTICLKCLEKEAAKRYADAYELAEDLRRFLAREPIRAKPLGRAARGWRWCRRNPVVASLLTAVGVLVLVVSVGAMVAAVRFGVLAERERDAAGREREAKQEAVNQLVRLNVANGTRLMDEGNPFGALLWFAEALRLDEGDPAREEPHRLRLGTVVDQCPRLVQVLYHEGGITHAEYSPDGHRVLTAGKDGTARVWDAVTGEQLVLLKPGQRIDYAIYSPDARHVLTAAWDAGVVQVCDAASGQPLGSPFKYPGGVRRVWYSPSGHQVLVAGRDAKACVWDPATGKLPIREVPLRLPAVPSEFDALSSYGPFSPDGRLLLTPGDGNQFRLWDAATGAPVGQPLKHRGDLGDGLFSPDGKLVLTSSAQMASPGAYGEVRVWDVATGREVTEPLKHSDMVVSLLFTPGGRRLVTMSPGSSSHAELRIWDVAGWKPLATWTQPASGMAKMVSPDGRRLLTVSGGVFQPSEVGVLDLATGEAVTPSFNYSRWFGGHVSFNADGQRLLIAADDGLVRIWELSRAGSRTLWHGGDEMPGGGKWSDTWGAWVDQVAFSPDGRRVVTACSNNLHRTARVWDASSGAPVTPVLRHTRKVQAASFSPDGLRVLTADEAAGALWDAQTGRLVRSLPAHERRVLAAAFSPDGRRVATAGSGTGQKPQDDPGEVRIWDADSGSPVGPPLMHERPVGSVAFSPDGCYVVTAGGDDAARVWDTVRSQLRTPSLRHKGQVVRAVFSPDGGRVVTASRDGTAQVWDAATGTPLAPPLAHGKTALETVLQASFSPDGRRLITACADNTARVWDAATGRPLTPPLRHGNAVVAASFSPDGRYILTASGYVMGPPSEARVWDAFTGEPITPRLRHRHAREVEGAAFGPDGRRLVTGGRDSTARLWDLVLDSRPVGDLRLLANVLSGYTLDATGSLAPLDPATIRDGWKTLRDRNPETFQSSAGAAAEWHRQQADEGEHEGQWFAVVWHLNRLLEATPDDADLLRRRARAWAMLDDWPKAQADWERLTTRKPADAAAWHQCIAFYQSFGKSAEAASVLDRAVRLASDDAQLRYDHGLARAQQGRPKEAAADFAKALALASKDARLSLQFARDHWEHKRRPEALAAYRQAMRLGPVAAEDHFNLAIALYEQNLLAPAAVAMQQAVAGNPQNAYYHDWLGLLRIRLGKPKEAVGPLREAVKLDPQNVAAHRNLGLALRDTGDLDGSVASLQRAIKLDARDAFNHFELGNTYAAFGRWEQAAAALGQGLALDPGNEWARHGSAALLLRTSDVEGYRRACREMLGRFAKTDQPDIAERLAKTCTLAPGAVPDFAGVLKLADQAVKGTEKHPYYRYFVLTKGLAEYRAGHYAPAVTWLKRAGPRANGSPVDVSAFAVLAMAYQRLGQADEARTALSQSEAIRARKMPDPAKGRRFGSDWVDWLHAEILLREAAGLGEGKKDGSQQ